MRGAGIAGLAVLSGLVVGGCGGGEAVYAGGSPATEKAKIRALLHDINDLPDGFSRRPRDGWTTPFRAADKHCRTALDAAAGRPPKQGLRTHAEVTFQGDGLGEIAGAGVASYTENARGRFEAIGDALADCSTLREGDGTVLTPAGLPIGQTGYATRATRLRGRFNGYPYEMHLVFVQAGEALISVVHAGVGSADPRRTEELARAVTAKMTGEAE